MSRPVYAYVITDLENNKVVVACFAKYQALGFLRNKLYRGPLSNLFFTQVRYGDEVIKEMLATDWLKENTK